MVFQGIAWHKVSFRQTKEVRLYMISEKHFFDQSLLFVALHAKEKKSKHDFVMNAQKINPCVRKKGIYSLI